MQRKPLIAAWLLLLVPTLLLGVGAWQLLQREDSRLELRERRATDEQLATVAANLELAIAEVEDGLLQSLSAFPQQDLVHQLIDWRQANPLVRNIFVWAPGQGLLYPDPQMPASDEESIFIRRYLPLFSGEIGWQQPGNDVHPPAASSYSSAADAVLNERKELRQLASKAPPPQAESTPAGPAITPAESGWRSWYADDQLHLLGWYRPADESRRFGVEIEMMSLLSRLLGALSLPGPHQSLALQDGSGNIIHQSGAFDVNPGLAPTASRNLTGLPHWRLNIYTDPAKNSANSGFLLIGSLLTGSFVAAILLGGSLLLWQSVRNQREARQKTSFVSNVSHELKTPLTTIRMYAELLGEGKITTADKQQQYLQTIIRESQRLSRLVSNILDFSRLEQGHRTFHATEIDLVALVEAVLTPQLLRLKEAGLKLEKKFDQRLPPLAVDRDAVEQILLNLLDNAIKYAAAGGLLKLELQSETQAVKLILSDRGPGIPAAQRQKIFEKFHRLDNSLTSALPGAGLGLSIARQLARGMGGELSCTGGETVGSCFCLKLPRPKELS